MKKEVLKRLIENRAEKVRKQKDDKLEAEGHYSYQTITNDDYREAMIEVLAELL
jgi:hypothetical protein